MRQSAVMCLVALFLLAATACRDPIQPSAEGGLSSADDAPQLTLIAATATIPDCGYEDGPACPAVWGYRCDSGLRVDFNVLLNLFDDTCVNQLRHLAGPQFRGTWNDWALASQRSLAADEPINWVTRLGTHNSYANAADNTAVDPNQLWSMSDQLDLGSRFIQLDLHSNLGTVRLCHTICFPEYRPLGYGFHEIRTWLDQNPEEVIMIDFELYLNDSHVGLVETQLDHYFGDILYRADERSGDGWWPSHRELRAAGKSVLVVTVDREEGQGFGGRVHRNYVDPALEYQLMSNFQVQREAGIVAGCSSSLNNQELGLNDSTFWGLGEDRTLIGTVFVGEGVVEPDDVRNIFNCNVPLLSLDLLAASRCSAVPRCLDFGLDLTGRIPDEERQPYAVWSWRVGDRGTAGDAAVLRAADGRWSSAPLGDIRRFACARPRSETTRDVDAWVDRRGEEWRVTSRLGPWTDGGRACLDEYGDEGFVFSVPVNGRMSGSLRLEHTSGDDLWINYNDIRSEGDFRINQRPRTDGGPDLVAECESHEGTLVQLDASASFDPEGDDLTFAWNGPFGTVTGSQPIVWLPLGRHTITVIGDDGFSGVSMDEVVVEVVDTSPPEIHSANVSPNTLWPPNHTMVATRVTVDVSDVCDPSPSCHIASVVSNEDTDGLGDGSTASDWEITGPLTVELRAERSGPGEGRVYTLTIECVDGSGNRASTQLAVSVPHDRGSP